jgi:hypothetical protein
LKKLIEAGVELQTAKANRRSLIPKDSISADLAGKLPGNGEKEQITPEDGLAIISTQRKRERDEALTFFMMSGIIRLMTIARAGVAFEKLSLPVMLVSISPRR